MRSTALEFAFALLDKGRRSFPSGPQPFGAGCLSNVLHCALTSPKSCRYFKFVRTMCERSKASAGSLFACITYIEKLRTKLPATASGIYCTRHRIFLSSLVCANKYCNDTPLRNKQWSRLTTFTLQEINLMERQLLFLLVCSNGSCGVMKS